MSDLTSVDIQYLHGVGPKRAALLASELGIRSYYDLLYYFPFRYIDRNTIHHISEIKGDMPYIQLKGKFVNFTPQGEGARRRLQALFTDGTGTIEVVWFNRVKSIQNTYRQGVDYVLFGKPTQYKLHYSIVHPEIDECAPDKDAATGLQGVYSLTEKLRNKAMSSRTIQKLVANLLASVSVGNIEDPLPVEVLRKHGMMPLGESLVNMHAPRSIEALHRAQARLKYEELFFLELHILKSLKGENKKLPGIVFQKVGDYFNEFYAKYLEFPLTSAQKRVIKEIRCDLGSGSQMNRLLQGDVGSGKTIVAFMTMLLALGNGCQACLMAPTEILATQHYESLSQMCAKIGVKIALLTGSTKKKEREAIDAGLRSGELQMLVGTHALIEDTVQFRNLGLAIIDEQHRFGVAQRAKLWQKNRVVAPHVLVMTATPIPRTLAMTAYGDLDVSVIDELPPGRKAVTTVLRYEKDRCRVYRFLGDELSKGRQVYIVYPLIEENEKMDMKDLENGLEIVRETFPDYTVSYVHGRMKPAEKDYQMSQFASGKAQILVATTVIEVGVNVPNASVMVIENAERFGLSQLHQLRGRVGRGSEQSYCILMSKYELSADTRHRLEVMTQTNDGFVLAEEDMKLRGPGDMEGTQQSGIPLNLKVANLASDGRILQLAREDVEALLAGDPELKLREHKAAARRLGFLFGNKVNWGRIS